MNTTFTGKNIKVTGALKEYIENKLDKIENYFTDDIECNAVLSTQKRTQTFEVTIRAGSLVFRVEENSNDMYKSIDKAVDRLSRQIRKQKTRLMKHKLDGKKSIRFSNITEEQDDNASIVKIKELNLKPMSEEEAMLQIELLGHDFFVFNNMKTDDINVLYKRKDGDYGLIVTQV